MSIAPRPASGEDGSRGQQDFDHAPLSMKVVFAGAGLLIMLLAAGVIHMDPNRFRGPRWVVFAVGGMFFLAALLMFVGRHRFVHPAVYMFFAAMMSSSLAVVFWWVAVWSKGPFRGGIAIGPVALVATPSSQRLPRLLFGVVALLATFLTGLGWTRWWRAIRGLPVDLSS